MKDRLPTIFTLAILLLIFSCEKTSQTDDPYPISSVDFVFLQAAKKLYVSVEAAKGYQGGTLDSVMVLWKGINASNTADTIRLVDDGSFGDMISKDGIYSRKIDNDTTSIKNRISDTAKDSVFLSILGIYSGKKLTESFSFLLGNIRPKLHSLIVPDTVTKPIANPDSGITNTIKFSVKALVSDPNGMDDIKRVFFRSYHVGLDSMMNGGKPILLYDDGTGDEGSGDKRKGDSTFTRNISIPDSAITGTYHWTFEAQDLSNAYSDIVKKVLVVQ